ncbi:cilia- and flagella-associated protein 43 isoform X2 [Toxorhynchites rutilus septentrionalis]|uniref:cilia- and flagella-associated protein 43 isoform X2 n=1 Tax=Toxorhynchites rutilus septentrionalis TaxID=329112 RepID=UPI0024787A3E|nr:cilia- and flagella-associated protein 43 isoform X2 [Toxorhynchites rutilus septentrionalis]
MRSSMYNYKVRKRDWIKVHDFRSACFVGKEALAMGMGTHILLLDVATRKESFYRATDHANGQGVACLTGHKSFSIYAFAESCARPRIFIVAYPENAILFVLDSDNKASRYVSLCFSENEYLVALTGIPDYSLELHVWRNKELLIKRRTSIHTDKQRIICSPSSPLTVCQLAYNKAQVTLWEIYGNVKICRLIEKDVKLPFGKIDAPLDVCFAIDGTLLIINKQGCVYSFSTAGQLNQIIKPSETPSSHPSYIFFCKGGIFISESSGCVSFFKRQKGIWNQLWTTNPPETYSLLLYYSASEGLYGMTVDGNFIRTVIDNDLKNIEHVPVKEFGCRFTDFIILNPLGEVMAGTNMYDKIIFIEMKSGIRVAEYAIDNMSCIQENPMYPFIAIGTSNGLVQLLSFYRSNDPLLLTDFHLSHGVILSIQFSEHGAHMAVFDKDKNIFLIQGLPGGVMEVVYHLETTTLLFQPTFSVFENDIQIFSLQQDSDTHSSSKIYQLTISLTTGNSETMLLDLPRKYTQLERKQNTNSKYYAVRYLSNEIDIIELIKNQNNDVNIKIDLTIKVKHQVPYFQIYADKFHLITWGMDGLTTIYDVKSDKLVAFFVAQDRNGLGVKRARCDPLHQYVLTLGQTGCLICNKIHRSSASAQHYNDLKLNLETDDVMSMFRNPTKGFSPNGLGFTRWIDVEKINRLESEKMEYGSQKILILDEFGVVKKHLKLLLDANEIKGEEERLPIQAFNINETSTEKLKVAGQIEREAEHQNLMNYVTSQEKINETIIKTCWSLMERKPVKVRSIFTKLAVENYSSLPRERDAYFLQKMTVYRETELMASHDALLPWKPTPTYQLESILNRDPDYGNVIDVLSRAAEKKHYTLTGTTTHLYVSPMPLRFEQLEVVSFEQLYFEKAYGNIEMLKLRDLFNKKFDILKTLKDNEMDVVLKRNNRLRVIHQEIETMSKLLETENSKAELIIDPQFQPDEVPDIIVNTKDSEISVAPYLTPSMKEALAQEKAERDRKQRELMADDFKERALMTMMDGVLEHRWEDEIKKTPPTPHCLETGKDPQYYNETDIREVKAFEEQLDFLYNERMRYKKLLEEEKFQIIQSLDEQISMFNTKVGEYLLEKIHIESAIREEEMRILRNTHYNYRRLLYDRKADFLRETIEKSNRHINELTEIMCELQDKVNDYKNTYETVKTKDRMLDKQFKINFSDTAQSAIIDQAYKIFKKRPKAQLRAVVTLSVYQDMAKRIMAKKISQQSNILLPQECVDYLLTCDSLDQPSNCPAGMDNNMWQTLCKMRRIKIESEFRLKYCEIQLADSEAALNAFQKEISSQKNALLALETKLQDLLHNKYDDSTNRDVQIIIKRGLIEVSMSGKTSDFLNCILIHRTDVDDINVVIKRAGEKKLKSMINAAIFRRKIIAQEWEHKTLKLEIRDLKDHVKMIEKCKITKEVQDWLKNKEMGIVADLGQLALEKEIENTIYAQEKMLLEVKKTVEELEDTINIKRKENKLLDKQTQELNIDVTEQHLLKDSELEENEQRAAQTRMAAIVDRARFVRLVQTHHSQILELGTILELQRLKTYPTLTAPSTMSETIGRHLK